MSEIKKTHSFSLFSTACRYADKIGACVEKHCTYNGLCPIAGQYAMCKDCSLYEARKSHPEK